MGKSTQYRNWAITWTADEHQLEQTSRDGFRFKHGSYDYVLFIGPKESPDNECSSDHQHVMVHCETSNISKAKCREALVAYSSLDPEVVQEKICYISKIYSTKNKYIVYIFKTLSTGIVHADDIIVKDVITELKEDGNIPSPCSIKRKLIDAHGANAFNKRFCKIAETYLSETDVIDSRGNPKIKMNPYQNRQNFVTQLLYYYVLLKQTKCSTLCKPFDKVKPEHLHEFVYLLSLLPYFTKRVSGNSDKLPSLYFYGVQNAGKSSMFNNCRYVKKVPTDSSGVSRFRMDKMHTTLLFDDIASDVINSKENSSSLKQLTLGNNVEIKTMGSTQNIQSFVIITSNETPSYLNTILYENEENKTINDLTHDIINDSWKRRFVSVNFVKQCPFDLSSINYNDIKLRDLAAQMFRNKYTKLQSDYPEYNDVLFTLDVYYDVALEDYAAELIDTEFDYFMEDGIEIVEKSFEDETIRKLMSV